MDVVYHAENHSMGWCLECHRAPEKNLRPVSEVTNLDYDVEAYIAKHGILNDEGELASPEEFGIQLKAKWNVTPKESCTTCHR